MKIFSVVTLMAMGLLTLTACGGSGNGNDGGSATVISGVASKGIIRNGTIKVYALNPDGSKGALLTETSTDGNGAYRADLGTYHGAILVEASGSYTDEATGTIKSVPTDSPLRAAIDNAGGETTVAVTPLTELAVVKNETPITHKIDIPNIAASNARISALYKVDILKTMPIDPLVANTTATKEQKEHALILAGFANLMESSGKDLHSVISDVGSSIDGDNKLAIPAAAQFQSALAGFAGSNLNRTGITDISSTQLINIGGSTRTLTLSAAGFPTLIAGIEVVITLPPGVTVKTTNRSLLDPVLQSTGGALSGTILSGSYTPPTAGMRGSVKLATVSAAGFSAGDFAALQCDIAPDAAPKEGDFILTMLDVIDDKGAPLTGVSVRAVLN